MNDAQKTVKSSFVIFWRVRHYFQLQYLKNTKKVTVTLIVTLVIQFLRIIKSKIHFVLQTLILVSDQVRRKNSFIQPEIPIDQLKTIK